MRWMLIVCLGVLFGTADLSAAETPFISDKDWSSSQELSGAGSGSEKTTSAAGPAFAIVMTLVVLVGIAGGGLLLVRLASRRRLTMGRARHLQLVESLPLGVKRSLHLVRLGDQVLVVGQHEQGLTAVTSVPLSSLPDLEASLAAEAAQGPAETAGQPGSPAAPAIPPNSSAFAHAFTQAVQSVLGRESR